MPAIQYYQCPECRAEMFPVEVAAVPLQGTPADDPRIEKMAKAMYERAGCFESWAEADPLDKSECVADAKVALAALEPPAPKTRREAIAESLYIWDKGNGDVAPWHTLPELEQVSYYIGAGFVTRAIEDWTQA